MSRSHCLLAQVIIVGAIVGMGAVPAIGQGVPEIIAFQGILTDGSGDPVPNGTYSITFTLFEAGTSTDVWTETNPSVEMVDGVFSVNLGAFTSLADVSFANEYELEIAPGGTPLSPKIELASTPYALALRGIRVENTVPDPGDQRDGEYNIIGGWHGNSVASNLTGATISGGGGVTVPGGVLEPNTVVDDFGTVGGGYGNEAGEKAVIAGGNYSSALGTGSAVGGGFNNHTDGPWGTVGGGRENHAVERSSTVGGGEENYAYAFYSTVGGGGGQEGDGNGGAPNLAYDKGTTVSGGSKNIAGDSNLSDVTAGRFASIGGGFDNQARIQYATIGGGESNRAMASHATIGGGGGLGDPNNEGNKVFDNWGTVGGGNNNIAGDDDTYPTESQYATVGGGVSNIAAGANSTIPGGLANIADGTSSLAAGNRAHASHNGSFVWNDTSESGKYLVSKDADTFNAKAAGGFFFYTDASASAGAELVAGSGTWASMSDRNMKENINIVDGANVLEKLKNIDVSTWNYTTQDETIVHMGPMAQDFYAAFGLGTSDRKITTIDADGVALAAIKGLYELVLEQQKEIERLKRMVE